MLLCGTFFDKDLNFRDELIEIFDVSEEVATVGAALEDRVDKVLGATGLRNKVDVSGVDGASTVCDYPKRGYKTSYIALQKQRFAKLEQALVTWWCIAHRLILRSGTL